MARYFPVRVLSLILVCGLFLGADGAPRWWRIYFTHPGRAGALTNPRHPAFGLIRLIRGAKKSFYGAFYEISSPDIVSALLAAHRRGIAVKLVVEKDNAGREAVRGLVKGGVEVVTDDGRGLMHHKFAVVDEEVLWTGSFNLTDNAIFRNNDNAVEIHSRELAAIYREEFEEMFTHRVFGNKREQGVFARLGKSYHVNIGGSDINAYFSPEDNVERILLKRIAGARESIHFMAFSFTSDEIAEALIACHKRGIRVMGVVEKNGSNSKFAEYVKLKIEGIPVRLDRNPYKLHHKTIIIDGERVITGSYNFSGGANRKNDENVLIIDNREIAREYLGEFHRLYNY